MVTWRRTTDAQAVAGVVAAPLFVATFSAIGAFESDYDWRRDAVSLLALGRRGWLQRANFIVTGSLYATSALALCPFPQQGKQPRAVPWLVAAVGIGLIGSGVFNTDPVGEYRPNAPSDRAEDASGRLPSGSTLEGRLHNLFAIPIFVGIPIAGLVSAIAATRDKNYRWALYSTSSSISMIANFVLFGMAFGQDSLLSGKGGLYQRLSIASGFTWLSALSLRAISS